MSPEKKASVKDVAALASVSLGTVSNVVNAPERVSAATRERVEQAIATLGWVPNESARSLRVGRRRIVAVVVLDIGNPFFTDLVTGAEDAVAGRGYAIQVGSSRQDARLESRQLATFEQQAVSGVLLAPIRGAGEAVRRLLGAGVPVVLLDRAGHQTEFCSVSVDDVEGGRLAVAHLVAQGHERIAVVGGQGDLAQVADRRQGAALAAAGRPGVRLTVVPTLQLDVESGVRAAEQLVRVAAAERPTAVFALNDLLAIGLLQGVVTAGLRVPEDVAIVGYDDIAFAAAAAVPLSSVRQPRHELGRRAVELLFDELDAAGRGVPHEHEQVRFTPELVVRRSSAARRVAGVVSG